MKRILFISAANPFSEVENRLRPLWPAYLAAYAEKHLGGGEIEFRYMRGRLEDELSSFKPHIVGISSVTQNYNYAIKYARIAKQNNLPVIIGGMHISSLPNCLSEDMDIGCIGEGEQTFLELIKYYLDTGGFDPDGLSRIHGIVYRDNGKLMITSARSICKPVDQLPHPKRSIIGYGYRGYLVTARGCPYKCIFCACTRHWGEVRYHSPEYVIEEIEELIRNGVKVIRFNDDNFVANKTRLTHIAEMMISRGFNRKAKYSCWCRSNNVTPAVVRLLKAMNIVSVKMGLESGCERTLQYLKGNVTVTDNLKAINLLKDAGIQVNGDFIIGAPDETEDEIMQTYDFIKMSRVDFVDINILSPLPGTMVWEYSVKKNLVSDDMDWSRLNFKFNGDESTAITLSETLSYQQIRQIYKKFLRLRFIKTLKALPTTPWLNELPGLAFKRLMGKVRNLS